MFLIVFVFFFFNDTAPTEIYTLSLHDALPIYWDVRWFEEPVTSDDVHGLRRVRARAPAGLTVAAGEYGATVSPARSEEHTSELQSHVNIVCRLLLEKKKSKKERAENTTLLQVH